MDPVQSLLERPKAYYNIDGVGELSIGFMCLSFAIFAWLQAHAPARSAWHGTPAFLIYMTAMCAILHYGSQAIKNRITYPRTGFVDYKPRDKYWIPAILGGAASLAFSIVLWLAVRRHWELSAAGTFAGALLALSYIRIALTVRWKWLVFVLMLAATFAIAVIPAETLETFANHQSLSSAVPARAVGAYWLDFIAYGILLLVSGGISMIVYLRHTQPPDPVAP